jgi:hypothetical protein
MPADGSAFASITVAPHDLASDAPTHQIRPEQFRAKLVKKRDATIERFFAFVAHVS